MSVHGHGTPSGRSLGGSLQGLTCGRQEYGSVELGDVTFGEDTPFPSPPPLPGGTGVLHPLITHVLEGKQNESMLMIIRDIEIVILTAAVSFRCILGGFMNLELE